MGAELGAGGWNKATFSEINIFAFCQMTREFAKGWPKKTVFPQMSLI